METSKENIDSYLKSFIYCFPAWIWVRNITRVGKVQPAKNFISLVVGWDYAVLIKTVLFHSLSFQCKAPTLSLKTFSLAHGKFFIKKRNNSEMKMERECKLFFKLATTYILYYLFQRFKNGNVYSVHFKSLSPG